MSVVLLRHLNRTWDAINVIRDIQSKCLQFKKRPNMPAETSCNWAMISVINYKCGFPVKQVKEAKYTYREMSLFYSQISVK